MEGLLLLLAVAVGAVIGAAATGIGIRLGRGQRKTPGDAPAPQSAPDTAEQTARDARFAAILANIDLYDGTDAGQREIAEE